MKKAFLLVLLLTVVSLAQAQSGRWGHFTQINPDSLSATGFSAYSVKLVSNANNLWAVWTHNIDNVIDTVVLHAGRYDFNSYKDFVLWDREHFTVFNLFKDTRNEAHIMADIGPTPIKSEVKYFTTGIFTATIGSFDTLWGQLEVKDSMGTYLGVGPAVNSGDSTVVIWCQTDYDWWNWPGDIYSIVYKTSSGWDQRKMLADGDDLTDNSWPIITTDANGKIWKGWTTWQTYSGGYKRFYVDGQIIDTNWVYKPELIADRKGTVIALWIVFPDSIYYRINVENVWQPKQFLTFADNIMSTKDGYGITWMAKTLDSVISVCTYDSLNWGSWDSVTVGNLSHFTVDQMGNPILGWFRGKNIYSGIYCRDSLSPTVSITSPVAGSEYTEGQQVPVHCTYSGDAAFLNIYCRRSGSSDWQKLFDMVSVDSSMNWTVPGDSSDYSFKAEAIDSGWNTSLDSTGWFAVKPLGVQGAPSEQAKIAFGLRNSGPNPFKRSAVINYQLSHEGPVQIKVYNANGQLVKTIVNASQNAGAYTARWNGNNEHNIPASAGVYVCRLSAAGQTASVKLIKLK